VSDLATWSVRPLVAVSLFAVGVAGCGQSDDRTTVRATAQRFVAAFAADQNEAACQALSSDTVKELESQEGMPCPEAIGELELAGGQVRAVEVAVTNANWVAGGGGSTRTPC